MAERTIPRSTQQGQTRLRPEEGTHRSAQIAVDMCHMNLQYMNTLSQFIPKAEMFHVQMNLLYALIDTMGATADVDPGVVLDMAKKYFSSLRTERYEMDNLDSHGRPKT